jgi:hypothetical protein
MRWVEFHGGAVACIEASGWLIKLRGTLKRGWYVHAQLREENAGQALWEAMEEEARRGRESIRINYNNVDGVVGVTVAKFTQRSGWLAWIIGYLSKAGLLDRNQELTAYVSFGLPYESPL